MNLSSFFLPLLSIGNPPNSTREDSTSDTMTKVFLTGATGYIGGSVLSLLAESHPEYAVRALVRDSVKGKLVKDAFAKVEIVEGELDDVDTITR
ncbi:hypothetical protein CTA2_1244, partial [Colletotrichum tanaceti]